MTLLAGCAPSSPSSRGVGADGEPQETQTSITVDRPLHLALPDEPPALAGKFSGGAGVEDYSRLFAAQLVRFDFQGNPSPVLVADVPSLSSGSWRVLPDGRNDTHYVLRPGVTWHDGTPFTAHDVVFTWQAIMNAELPASDREPESRIEVIEADDLSFRIRWKGPYIYADSYQLVPLPKHLLSPLLERDAQAFLNAPYWRDEWVGLGPYAIAEWIPGSHLRGRAFPGYVLGQPKVREVFVHFVADPNQAVARVLAGTLDLTLGSVIKIEEGAVLKQQWEAQGEGRVLTTPDQVRIADFQFRDPQRPAARDVRVRQAMAHAIDRQLMTDTLHFGLTLPAHMFIAPAEPAFAQADRLIRKYLHDPARASQMLAEAGWMKGADGVVRTTSGERLEFQIQSLDTAQYVKEAQVLGEFHKAVGVDVQFDLYPRARNNDLEYRASFQGLTIGSPASRPETMKRWRSDAIASEATKWRGDNRGTYARGEVDRLSDAFYATLEARPRIGTMVQLLQLLAEDLPSIPLYYPARVFAVRAGLVGADPHRPGEGWTVFNAHSMYWEK